MRCSGWLAGTVYEKAWDRWMGGGCKYAVGWLVRDVGRAERRRWMDELLALEVREEAVCESIMVCQPSCDN